MPLRKVRRPLRDVLPAIEALAALTATAASLRLFPFQRVRAMLRVMAAVARRTTPRVDAETLLWAIEAARRRCPVRTTCLSEALTAEALFRQHGFEAVLCIGATRRQGRFEAHAWVERDGVVVIGGPPVQVAEYARFQAIERVHV